jgi:hypothetical protein
VPDGGVSQPAPGFSDFFSGLLETGDQPNAAAGDETTGLATPATKPTSALVSANRGSKREFEPEQRSAPRGQMEQDGYSRQVLTPVLQPIPAKKDVVFALPLNAPADVRVAPSGPSSIGDDLQPEVESAKASPGMPLRPAEIRRGWITNVHLQLESQPQNPSAAPGKDAKAPESILPRPQAHTQVAGTGTPAGVSVSPDNAEEPEKPVILSVAERVWPRVETHIAEARMLPEVPMPDEGGYERQQAVAPMVSQPPPPVSVPRLPGRIADEPTMPDGRDDFAPEHKREVRLPAEAAPVPISEFRAAGPISDASPRQQPAEKAPAMVAEGPEAGVNQANAPSPVSASPISSAPLNVAFAARLVPVSLNVMSHPPAEPETAKIADPATLPSGDAVPSGDAMPPGDAEPPAPQLQQRRDDESRAAAGPVPKDPSKQRMRDGADGNEGTTPAPNMAPVVRAEAAKENPARAEKITAPEPTAQTARTAAGPADDTRPSTPAREIQLQVNQGTQRVDVRVTDRGGEVHVAVRTPDAQLAGTLRGELPALSAKLEQTGFRAETWHPAAASQQEHTRLQETSSASTRQDGRNQPRQDHQEQSQGQQHRPKQPVAESATTTSKRRKAFAWFMSQVR